MDDKKTTKLLQVVFCAICASQLFTNLRTETCLDVIILTEPLSSDLDFGSSFAPVFPSTFLIIPLGWCEFCCQWEGLSRIPKSPVTCQLYN